MAVMPLLPGQEAMPFTSEGHLLSAEGRWHLFRGTIGMFVQQDFLYKEGHVTAFTWTGLEVYELESEEGVNGGR